MVKLTSEYGRIILLWWNTGIDIRFTLVKKSYGIDKISYYLLSLNGLLYTPSPENNEIFDHYEIFEIKLFFMSIFF